MLGKMPLGRGWVQLEGAAVCSCRCSSRRTGYCGSVEGGRAKAGEAVAGDWQGC